MGTGKAETKLSLKHKKSKLTMDDIQMYSMCAIPMLLVFIFCYLPMVGIIIAFKNYRFDKGLFGSKWTGLENFKFFLQSNDFLNITWNTLSLNFIFITIGVIAAVSIALLLFELRSRTATKIYQTLLLTPHFMSWVVVGYMAYALLSPSFGLINTVIKSFGIEAIDWYSKPNAWPVILTIASVWKSVGMDCVIYYAALMGLDTSYFEAAEVDGANKWQVTKHVVLPSLVPLLVIMTILKIGNIFRSDFGLFYQLTRDVGALYSTTDVIDTYIFRTMRVIGDMGMSSAAGLLQSVVGFILVVVTNHLSKKIDPENGLF